MSTTLPCLNHSIRCSAALLPSVERFKTNTVMSLLKPSQPETGELRLKHTWRGSINRTAGPPLLVHNELDSRGVLCFVFVCGEDSALYLITNLEDCRGILHIVGRLGVRASYYFEESLLVWDLYKIPRWPCFSIDTQRSISFQSRKINVPASYINLSQERKPAQRLIADVNLLSTAGNIHNI